MAGKHLRTLLPAPPGPKPSHPNPERGQASNSSTISNAPNTMHQRSDGKSTSNPSLQVNNPQTVASRSHSVESANLTQNMAYEGPGKEYVMNAWVDDCPKSAKHALGIFCFTCRSQPMAWLPGDIPVVTDDHGQAVTIGPEMSMVEGVHLDNNEAVAVLSIVVSLDVFSRRYTDIEGFVNILGRHPKSVEAGQRIADVYHDLRRRALHPRDSHPEFHEIVYAALLDPFLRADQYELNVMNTFVPLPKTSEEVEAAKERDLDSFQDPDDDLLMTSRPALSSTKYNRPGPRTEGGDWQFVEGTDITLAVLGQAEPHKFFLIREKKSDSEVQDLREYPGWKGFDWHSVDDIAALNKHRQQIKYRMGSSIAPPRPLWTEQEKDTLKKLVKEDLDSGKTRRTIDWDNVAARLRAAFEGIIQRKGMPLAQPSILVNGVWAFPGKQAKLKEDREGPVRRNGTGIKAQSIKYHDIRALLGEGRTDRNTRKRGRESDEVGDAQEDEDLEAAADLARDGVDDIGDDVSPTMSNERNQGKKKVEKRSTEDMPSRAPKRPRKSPPPGPNGLNLTT
ncbi:hypothetical protein EG329_009655 [Mollisiaceae sp. DMI_Dod_QoI]|nr:hypothetical protein EG329_009655 [Helotiales sp. DMI_Dod_QoI]